MAGIFNFGAGFGSESIAAQARALDRADKMLQVAPPNKSGEMLATALGNRRQELRVRAKEETTSRMMNEELTKEMERQSANGGQVNTQTAYIQTLMNTANLMMKSGLHSDAQQMYQKAIAAQQEYEANQAALGKIRSETIENLRPPQAPAAPEIVRLQEEHSRLAEQLASGNLANEAPIRRRMDQLQTRINTIAEGKSVNINSELTTGAETQAQTTLLGLEDQAVRLDEIASRFDPTLLTPSGKIGVLFAMGADKFGTASPEQKAQIDAWTSFSQSAKAQLNAVLKEISGAAVSNQEFARHLAVELDTGTYSNPFSGDTPQEFTSKLRNKQRWVEAAIVRYRTLLAEGVIKKDGDKVTDEMVAQYPLEAFVEKEQGQDQPKDLVQYYLDLAQKNAEAQAQ